MKRALKESFDTAHPVQASKDFHSLIKTALRRNPTICPKA